MSDDAKQVERLHFLKLAFLFQGSLLLAAVVAGLLIGPPVWQRLFFSTEAVGWGIAATIPMLLLLWSVYQSQLTAVVQIRELLREVMGKPLAACNGFDLCALALLAGFSEEFLFRGLLEPWCGRWGWLAGMLICNVLFGLCHAVTPLYAVVASLMGIYLSLSMWLTKDSNLLIPILCHSLYDLIAFHVVKHSFCVRNSQDSPMAAPDPINDVSLDSHDAPDNQ